MQPELDLKHAVRNIRDDILGEWCRDPWDRPELGWLVRQATSPATSLIRSTGVGRAVRVDVPKAGLETRPVLVIDEVDHLAYQALVDHLSGVLLADTKPWVYGWRLAPRRPVPGRYQSNQHEWRRYARHMEMLSATYKHALCSDVVAFTSSISIDRLSDALLARCSPTTAAARLANMIRRWDGIAGCSGLPAGLAPSIVLGNFYLEPLDEALGVAGRHSRTPYARYIDNIWAFDTDVRGLRSLEGRLRDAVRGLDLRLSPAKTGLFSNEEVIRQVELVTHMAADAALADPKRADRTLDGLIDQLLIDPEHADRTWVRLATARLAARPQADDRILAFVAAAERMPHCSDILAALFRTSGRWRQLQHWYVEIARSGRGGAAWSVAQLARMFPSEEPPASFVVDQLAEQLTQAPRLETVMVAAQRLAAWAPLRAIDAIRESAKHTGQAAVRRALALAAIMCGEERAEVRRMLSEFEENAVTLAMLEDRRFRAPSVRSDW